MDDKIDLIDKKILTELDKNSRQSNNQIGKRLKVSRERVDYRIKRMLQKGIIKKFPTIINPTKFGYSMHKIYFQFQNLSPIKEGELISWLVKNPFIQWVASCKGKWDLNAIVFANDVEHFNFIMQEFYNKYGEYIFSQNFNITLSVGNMEKGWILGEKKDNDIIYTANEREDIGLDKTDLEILKIIANNSRMSIIDIAQKLKQTPRIIQYRIKNLENKEVIKGYTISLDYILLKKQFYKVVFYMSALTDDLRKRIISYCRNRSDMPYFIFCVGEWPLEVEYVVDDINQFYEDLEDIKKHFPEIRRHESIWLSKEYKFDFMPLCYKPIGKD